MLNFKNFTNKNCTFYLLLLRLLLCIFLLRLCFSQFVLHVFFFKFSASTTRLLYNFIPKAQTHTHISLSHSLARSPDLSLFLLHTLVIASTKTIPWQRGSSSSQAGTHHFIYFISILFSFVAPKNFINYFVILLRNHPPIAFLHLQAGRVFPFILLIFSIYQLPFFFVIHQLIDNWKLLKNSRRETQIQRGKANNKKKRIKILRSVIFSRHVTFLSPLLFFCFLLTLFCNFTQCVNWSFYLEHFVFVLCIHALVLNICWVYLLIKQFYCCILFGIKR